MDLNRVSQKFATNSIWGLNPTTAVWEDLEIKGNLQVYDRFITERSFGQKKRILTLEGGNFLPESYGNFMLEGGDNKYILESKNEDIRFNDAYGLVYLMHTAYHQAQIISDVVTELASGISTNSGEVVSETHWIDIERYSSDGSRVFDDVAYTVTDLTFPKIANISLTQKIKLVASGHEYSITEIFDSLDVIVVRGKRVGL